MSAGRARSPAGERGSALILVLFLFVICEVAALLAALEVQRIAALYGLEKEHLAADLLADSGGEHALARLRREPSWRGDADGVLANGSYAVTLADRGPGAVRITSVGRAAGGRSVELVLDAMVVQGRWRVAAEGRRHFMAEGEARPPERGQKR